MKYYLLSFALFMTALGASAQVSPYIFPDFVKANVLQKNGGATEASMNYNTVSEEMLFLDNGTKTVLDGGNVDTIFLQNKKFVPVGNVYYQKLTDTKVALYIEHHFKMLLNGKNPDLADQANNTITASQGIKTNATSSSKYELKLGESYTLENLSVFWLQKGKSFYKIDDLKKIIKMFPGKEADISAYVKDNKLDITKAYDLAKLIIYCNKP